MGDEWYCRIGGVEQGPLPFPELVELAASKRLSPRDELRFGSEGPWTRADSVAGLFQVEESEPPPKPSPSAEPEPEFAHDLAEFQFGYEASPVQVATAGELAPADPYAVDWYAKSLGLEFGRMTFRELVEMAARGVLAPADRVRPATSNDWRPAHTVPAIQSALATASRGESSAPVLAVPRTTVTPPAPLQLPTATPATAIAAPATPAPMPSAIDKRDNEESPAPRADSHKKGPIVAVVATLAVCAAGGAFLLFRAPSEQSQYQQLSGLYEEMKSLRERKASDREWSLLADRIKRDVMPWVASISRSQPGTPAGRALFEAGRDHLLPMLGESRRRPGPHEKEFIKRLEEARTALGGKG